MNEDQLVELMRGYFAGLFPRDCATCGRHYATLRQYILETERISEAISYDAELEDWVPDEPIGGVALANCPCGSTLTLSTEGIPLDQVHGILEWMKRESGRTGETPRQLLERLRDWVRAWALQQGE